MKAANTLSWQLLKSVLSIYFSITVVVTLTQMGVEYQHTRDMIQSELASVEQTFYPALATALWEINAEQLDALQQGILELPLISSIHIVDAAGREMSKTAQESVIGANIQHSFKITYRFDGQDVHLADVSFFAADTVAIDRLKLGYQMILLSALIKSTALTLLFIWAFRRRLGDPLAELTTAVAAIDLDSLGRSRIDLKQKEENELSKLEHAFNHMLNTLNSERRAHDANLEALNKSLEEQVAKRTKELEAANHHLQQLTRTDPMTGIANRRHFIEQADTEIQRARRTKCPLSLLMVDLDNFKLINDKYGHATGDEVLCNFADTTTNCLRSIDLLARIGGEEFAILLPDTAAEGAREAAQRILASIRQQFIPHGDTQIRYSISIGVATLQKEDAIYESILNRADLALYRAKEMGRNRAEIG